MRAGGSLAAVDGDERLGQAMAILFGSKATTAPLRRMILWSAASGRRKR
jgi:hypothetical protein